MDRDGRIVITETDHRRLERLLETAGARHDAASLEALDNELARAEVVPAGAIPPTVVTMSSAVKLQDLDSGEELRVTLVFPRDADARRGRISVLAPVGLALLGCSAGDVVEWPIPRRTRRLRIERVLHQLEASGRLDP
jgi:regulator of nucleoside diphosphate kinase